MPNYADGTKIELPQYKELMRRLKEITDDKKLIATQMRTAMRFATLPAKKKLTANVNALGSKSGNLRRAVAVKAKAYEKTGNAVVLIGFIKPGKATKNQKKKGMAAANHQHLVEYGTKVRYVKRGYIASSYKDFPFKIRRLPDGGLVTQGYPSSFFKRSSMFAGRRLSTGKMPVGGNSGKPPVKDAFMSTASQINSRLVKKTPKVIDGLFKKLLKVPKA